METVNNVVNAASKAIWGESKATPNNETAGSEPVSGQPGAGTATDPFDKGNDDTAITTNPSTSNSAPSTSSPLLQKQEGADRSQEEPSAAQTSVIDSKTGAAEAKIELDHPLSDQEREKLAEKGQLPHDPNDHSGEPLKVHDGTEKKERSASVSHEGGGQHGKTEGTGEQWVKTSGMAAEGGDFDATKPGAAKEATRLLEQKGIHRDGDNHGTPADVSSPSEFKKSHSPDSEKKKVSKMDKLKDKLHIGTGKHI